MQRVTPIPGRWLVRAAAALVPALLLTACPKDPAGPATAASIYLSPSSPSVRVGDTVTFSATVMDASGDEIQTALTWDHSNPSIVRMEPIAGAGIRVIALAAGVDTIFVQSGSVHDFAVLTVTAPASISFGTPTGVLQAGMPKVQLSASTTAGTIDTIQFRVNESPWLSTTAALPASSPVFNARMGGLPVGQYTVHFRARGSAGDTARTSMQYTLTLGDAHRLFGQLNLMPTGIDSAFTLTRANLVRTMVHLFGQGANAATLNGTGCYADVVGHWANGYICLYKNMAESVGWQPGNPDGTFGPNGTISYGDVIGHTVRMLRLPLSPSSGWPNNYIDAFVDAGLLPPGITKQQLTDRIGAPVPAYMVSALLYQAWTKHTLSDGRTLGQTYVDATNWRKW